jgi:hypothetical protein
MIRAASAGVLALSALPKTTLKAQNGSSPLYRSALRNEVTAIQTLHKPNGWEEKPMDHRKPPDDLALGVDVGRQEDPAERKNFPLPGNSPLKDFIRPLSRQQACVGGLLLSRG